jgi:hypothetical protein
MNSFIALLIFLLGLIIIRITLTCIKFLNLLRFVFAVEIIVKNQVGLVFHCEASVIFLYCQIMLFLKFVAYMHISVRVGVSFISLGVWFLGLIYFFQLIFFFHFLLIMVIQIFLLCSFETIQLRQQVDTMQISFMFFFQRFDLVQMTSANG